MKMERSVWFGVSGTPTVTIRRRTVTLLPTVVVVLRTVIATWSGPQRSASAAVPTNRRVVTTTFGFTVAAVAAATAFVTGRARDSALSTATAVLRIPISFLRGQIGSRPRGVPRAGRGSA
jgi:hypothetical protein